MLILCIVILSLSLSLSVSLCLSLCLSVCLSLSLSLYIYIYIYICKFWVTICTKPPPLNSVISMQRAISMHVKCIIMDHNCISYLHHKHWLITSIMMTSSNGNIFRVTGPLYGEFTVSGEFPAQRPVAQSFDVFFDLRPNKRPLWRHYNVTLARGTFLFRSWRPTHSRAAA